MVFATRPIFLTFSNGHMCCVIEMRLWIMDLNCGLGRAFLLWIIQTPQPSKRFILWFAIFATNHPVINGFQWLIQQSFNHFGHSLAQHRPLHTHRQSSSTELKHTTPTLDSVSFSTTSEKKRHSTESSTTAPTSWRLDHSPHVKRAWFQTPWVYARNRSAS